MEEMNIHKSKTVQAAAVGKSILVALLASHGVLLDFLMTSLSMTQLNANMLIIALGAVVGTVGTKMVAEGRANAERPDSIPLKDR